MANKDIYRCVYEGGRVYVGTAEEIHRVYGLKPATIIARARSRHCVGGVWTRRVTPNPLALWAVIGYRMTGIHASFTDLNTDVKNYLQRAVLAISPDDTYYWAADIKPTMLFMDRAQADHALAVAIDGCQRHHIMDPHVVQIHVID